MENIFSENYFENLVNSKLNEKIRNYSENQHDNVTILKYCSNCGEKSKFRCSVCKLGRYCSIECQRENWSYHKRYCKPEDEIEYEVITQTEYYRRLKHDPVFREFQFPNWDRRTLLLIDDYNSMDLSNLPDIKIMKI